MVGRTRLLLFVVVQTIHGTNGIFIPTIYYRKSLHTHLLYHKINPFSVANHTVRPIGRIVGIVKPPTWRSWQQITFDGWYEAPQVVEQFCPIILGMFLGSKFQIPNLRRCDWMSRLGMSVKILLQNKVCFGDLRISVSPFKVFHWLVKYCKVGTVTSEVMGPL